MYLLPRDSYQRDTLETYKKLSINNHLAVRHKHHPRTFPGGAAILRKPFFPLCLLICHNHHFCCCPGTCFPRSSAGKWSTRRAFTARWMKSYVFGMPRDKNTRKPPDLFNVSFTFALCLFFSPIETWSSRSQTGLDRLSRARDAALCRTRPAASSHYLIHLFEDFSLKGDKSSCHGHFPLVESNFVHKIAGTSG